jgi:hypothetical protein
VYRAKPRSVGTSLPLSRAYVSEGNTTAMLLGFTDRNQKHVPRAKTPTRASLFCFCKVKQKASLGVGQCYTFSSSFFSVTREDNEEIKITKQVKQHSLVDNRIKKKKRRHKNGAVKLRRDSSFASSSCICVELS